MVRILVIDDDDTIRGLFKKMLEREGYEVEVASNGKEGVRAFRENEADLVITDLIMPEQEGIETIVQLHNDYPALKIIAMSGGGRVSPDGYLDSAQRLGAARAYAKPVKREVLLSAIEELLGEASS